jgi:hypothetical protein
VAAAPVRGDRAVPVVTGFGSLYYTDCRPGQGLTGGAGFQFQAASPGLAGEAMSLVARAGLYEPPAAWMREQRPVDGYPLSLAHVVEGDLLVTAAGRYLGKEANGNREGNQFTHAVVTREGADYGLVRPAQLWAAPWWAGGPATGTELAPLPASPATGPLDTETVRERVLAVRNAERLLLTLLSALHRLAAPGARRPVVLVAADPEQAACWIAAATMLLPSPEALRTSFKIFVAEPQNSGHDIIAVHPEWAGRWADTGPDTGLVVVDLDGGRHTAVEPTEQALFWVPRFLRDDAYDVVDAVELAAQFARGDDRGADPTGADRIVAMVLAAGVPLGSAAEVAAAAGWLRNAPEQAVALARDVVVDAVLQARPGGPVLRTLAAAAGGRGWEVGGRVNRGVLAAELAEVLEAPSGAAALEALQGHPDLLHVGRPPSEEDQNQDRELVADALPAAAPDRVPALLWLTRRHRVQRRGDRWDAALHRFVPWWLTCDEPAFAEPRWAPLSTELLPEVRGELARMLDAGGEQARLAGRVVRLRWWSPLWPTALRPTEPLDGLLIGTAYPRLRRADQDALVRTVLRALGDVPPRGRDPTSLAWELLFAGSRPTLDRAATVVEELVRLGMGTAPDVAAELCAVLDAEPGVSRTALDIAEKVRTDGQPLSPRQARRLAERAGLLHLPAQLAGERPAAEIAGQLNGTEVGVLAVTAPEVVDALIAAPAARATPVVCGCRRDTLTPLYQELERRWPRPAAVVTDAQARAAALTFELVHAGPGDREQRDDFVMLRTRLGRVVAALAEQDRARIAHAGLLGDRWAQWVAGLEPKRWSMSRLSRSGRHAGPGSLNRDR